MEDVRLERDALGEVPVPSWALWGAQTQRALENFPISGIRFPRPFIRALGLVKKIAAQVNARLGLLDERKAQAIATASQEVSEGKWDDHFPLDIFQTGSGTSTNMNANEVIANRACELLGGSRGDKGLVHPNDEVNLGQSSNDVIPSCIHISCALTINESLLPAIGKLRQSLNEKAQAFADIVKTGRTHLMDAMPVTLGQEFAGYEAQLSQCEERIRDVIQRLCLLAIGGTAVGTGINTHPDFGRLVAEGLKEETGLPFQEAPNHFAAQGAMETAVEVSGALKTLAVALHKIANDLRWMNSGPQAGLAEIRLPALQPGSSIMPGKVNPVIPEAVMMVAMQVFGADVTVTAAAASGNFELNVALPVMAHNLLQSIQILSSTCNVLAEKCVNGIVANRDHMERIAGQNAILATALTPVIGYDRAAQVVRKATAENKTLKQVVSEMNLMPEQELNRLLDLKRLTQPGFVAGMKGGS